LSILWVLVDKAHSTEWYSYELILVSAEKVRAEFIDSSIMKLYIEWPGDDVRTIYVNLDVVVNKMYLTGLKPEDVTRGHDL
jgi:hypothetical protein